MLHVGYGRCGGLPPDTGPFSSADAEPETSETGVDAQPETSADAPPETSAECCPIAETPSCDCFATGGSKSQPGGCHGICDAKPTAASKSVDSNGCPIWNVGPGSCLETFDGGPG